jgi:NAD(P)-dependent dehydrogenase (short-subunit alcohol dehydrogenase family)
VLLRWKLAVVVGGGAGLGREVCLRLARAGSGVLVADGDRAAADATADAVRERRVSAWSLPVGATDDLGVTMLAARCRDLGGADLVVVTGLDPDRAAVVAAAVLPGAAVTDVLRTGSDADVAVAVLAVLRTAEPGAAVVCC